jgi:uncharacterized membrane protein YcaP (DUF421 family)
MTTDGLIATALRGGAMYLYLLVIIRILGKRTIGNFTAFDLIIALILGDLVGEVIFGQVPVAQGLVALAVVAGLALADSLASFRWPSFDRLTGGSPSVLIRDGTPDREEMARNHVNDLELEAMLRLNGLDSPSDVRLGTLETNGSLSTLLKDGPEPLSTGEGRA